MSGYRPIDGNRLIYFIISNIYNSTALFLNTSRKGVEKASEISLEIGCRSRHVAGATPEAINQQQIIRSKHENSKKNKENAIIPNCRATETTTE